MKREGYRVIAVNPNETEVFGERAYGFAGSGPPKIRLVDIFRGSSEAGNAVVMRLRWRKGCVVQEA